MEIMTLTNKRENSNNLLEMNNVTKKYPGVTALDNVTFSIKEGEIHALLGANGAGKSTLVKVLCGVTPPDSGEILLNGKRVSFPNPASAIKQGISYVPQELSLVPTMNACQNILLGQEPLIYRPFAFIDEKRLINLAKQSLDSINLTIDPNQPIKNIPVSAQQMISIATALFRQSNIIILDEPTSSLASREILELFEIMRKLRQTGHTIVFITHRLDEVFEVADRITILRDGIFRGCFYCDEISKDEVVALMVGKQSEKVIQNKEAEDFKKDEALRLENVHERKIVKNISFSLHVGEILGLYGQVGSGRTEILRGIFGAEPYISGEIYVFGKRKNIKSPIEAIKLGIGFITEDRKNQGLILSMDLSDNISMANYDQSLKFGIIQVSKIRQIAEYFRETLKIKNSDVGQWTKLLSGGNQQKVILAKWLNRNSKILLMDEPTKGIDVGTKKEFYSLIRQMATKGVSVLLVTSEIEEAMELCDRVLIMKNGNLVADVDPAEVTREKIVSMSL
jgi:ribose transport system ATP-binding protein